MKSLIKNTLLKPLTLAVIVNLMPFSALFAANPPGGGTCDGTDEETCSSCGEESSGDSEECDSSFNFSLNIGYARMNRNENLLDQSKLGLQTGQAGKGYYRDFDAVRNDFFQRTNTTNRVMEKLSIIAPSITSALYSPSALSFDSTTLAEYLTDSQTGQLRQALTESSFVNIALLSEGDGYTITTWNRTALTSLNKDSNGFYTVPTSTPISIITFRKPVGEPSQGLLLVSKEENFSGATLKTAKLYDQSNPDVEIIRHYQGDDQTGTLMEETILTFTNRGAKPWDYTFEKVVKRASNNNGIFGNLVVVSKIKETHRDFSLSPQGGDFNGKRLMSVTKAFGTTEAQTTTYDYYEDPTNLALHGRLKSVNRPDGSWEYHEYTGDENSAVATEVKYSSWKDVPFSSYQQGIKEETVISANEATRTTSIAGQQISKKMFLTSKDPATGNITSTEQGWDGSEWAITSTVFASQTATGPEAGRPLHTTHPDGTVTLHQYSVSSTEDTVTTLRGAGDTSAVTAGTKTVTTYNQMNEVTFQETRDIESDLQLTIKSGSDFDSLGRAQRWTYNADENDYEITQYSCCGIGVTRDRSGATRTYSRDALKRVYKVISQSSSTDTPITTNTIYDGLTATTNRTDGTTTLFVSESTRSLGGLTSVSKRPDANGDGTSETTTTVTSLDPVNGTTRTTTHPDGTTTSTQNFLDGSQKSSTDQLGRTTTNDKNTHAENGGGIVTRSTAANGTQWTENYNDPLGRTFKTLFAGGAQSTQTYQPFSAAAGSRGKAASSTDPDGITTTYAYNAEGEQTTTTRPMPNGQQGIIVTEQDVVSDTFTGVASRTQSTVNSVLTSTSLRSADGYRSKSINHLANDSISTSERTVPNDGAWTVTTTSPDGTYSVSTVTNGLTVKQETFGSDDILIMSSEMTYDAFDRALKRTDSRTGETWFTELHDHDEDAATAPVRRNYALVTEAGSPLHVEDPGGRITKFTYDVMGRRLTVDAPDTLDADGNTLSNITHASYTATGQVAGSWGDQTNATFNLYDDLDRIVELRTYRNLAHGTEPTAATTGADSTTWTYSPTRGFLTRKEYADGNGTEYSHPPAGRIATRTWARGVITTYIYDAGMLVETDYSDTTQDITLTYDNFGRPVTQSNGLATSTFAYDPATLQIDTETIAYDFDLDGTADFTRVLDREQDALLRDTGWQLKDGTTVENEAAYSYSNIDGRGTSISGGGLHPPSQFNYSYEPNSNLVATITSPAHTVTNTWETDRNVLSLKENKVGSTNISSYDYTVNAIGQRTNVSQTGTAFGSTRDITWGYDSLGQVVSADSTIPGLDRAYQFDMIGNRLRAATGSIDVNDPTATVYTPNALNQYSSITNPQSTIINPEYDSDGNATAYPLPADPGSNSTLVWDGENRLISATVNGVTTTYRYDAQSRRIAIWSAGLQPASSPPTTTFVYDDWNPIAEYNSSYALTKTYTWGMDLSGSMQGAGGVGGLLLITDHSAPGTPSYYPLFDGNGNVSEYLDSAGAVQAHYEYDPFGRITVATGSNSADFSHRFSTKPLDAATGLYYYGYRYYDPVTGRWPSRDPIEEEGGVNIYSMVSNNALDNVDYLGLAKYQSNCSNVGQVVVRVSDTKDTETNCTGSSDKRVSYTKNLSATIKITDSFSITASASKTTTLTVKECKQLAIKVEVTCTCERRRRPRGVGYWNRWRCSSGSIIGQDEECPEVE